MNMRSPSGKVQDKPVSSMVRNGLLSNQYSEMASSNTKSMRRTGMFGVPAGVTVLVVDMADSSGYVSLQYMQYHQ